VDAVPRPQVDVLGVFFEVFRISRELPVPEEEGAKARTVEYFGLCAIGDGQLLRAPDLQKKIVLLVQVKGRRRAR
jgi:hypothetical protein